MLRKMAAKEVWEKISRIVHALVLKLRKLNLPTREHCGNMRKYYIDNMRWIIILLLIPYHAAMAWNIWGEPTYIFFESNKTISSIVVFFSPYLMPLMFLIAGISTRLALQKRTIGQYVLERAKKLLIPFVFGTILIMPFMTYIADKFNCGYQGDLFQHYAIFFTKFTDLIGADGGFSVGQFWFILYLFLISLIAIGIISLQRKIMRQKDADIPLILICLWGLPLPFLSELLSTGGKSLAEYTYIFLVGYYIFSNDDVISKVEKYKWIFLCIGLSATVCNVYMFIWSDTQRTLLNMTAKYISEWFMINAMLGVGKKYLNFGGKVSKYLSKRSYTFYIFHFIWLVLFQYLLFNICSSNIILLYVLPVLLAYGATLLCCEICNRGQSAMSRGNRQGK